MEKIKKFSIVSALIIGLVAGTTYFGTSDTHEQAIDACESWYYTDC